MVTLLWAVFGIVALCAAGLVGLLALRRGHDKNDLGSVSNSWVSEYRLGHMHEDSSRF